MRQINLVTDMCGYVFNEESGMLESYEFIKADIYFKAGEEETIPVVKVTCKMGDETAVLTDPEVYKDEDAFRAGEPTCSYYTTGMLFSEAGHKFNYMPEMNAVWVFVNGKADCLYLEDIRLEVTAGEDGSPIVRCPKYGDLYFSESMVYMWNDLIVKEADGTTRVVKSLASILSLTEEQKKLVTEFKGIRERLAKAGVALVLNQSDDRIQAYNVSNLGDEHYPNFYHDEGYMHGESNNRGDYDMALFVEDAGAGMPWHECGSWYAHLEKKD